MDWAKQREGVFVKGYSERESREGGILKTLPCLKLEEGRITRYFSFGFAFSRNWRGGIFSKEEKRGRRKLVGNFHRYSLQRTRNRSFALVEKKSALEFRDHPKVKTSIIHRTKTKNKFR